MAEEFEQLAKSAGNVVGEHEIAMRKQIGDARYDEIQRHNDEVADANLSQVRAVTGALHGLRFMRRCIGVAVLVAAFGMLFAAEALLLVALR